MQRIYSVIILCSVLLIVVVIVNLSEAKEGTTGGRQKRFLSFRNTSHFFIRLNFKANMVPWNQIFAQAVGFRMNWDDPPDTFHPYHHLRIRRTTLYSRLETLLDRNRLNGFHCVRRAICEIETIAEPKGIYHIILKMVFRQISSSTDKWHKTTKEECQLSTSSCPFSILEVSRYTDF